MSALERHRHGAWSYLTYAQTEHLVSTKRQTFLVLVRSVYTTERICSAPRSLCRSYAPTTPTGRNLPPIRVDNAFDADGD